MAGRASGRTGVDLNQGDIYFVSLDPAVGHEQQGQRPVLIISRDVFNQVTSTAVIVPISSGAAFARWSGYAVSLMAAGTRTTGVIRCDQLRTVDIAARQGRRLEAVPAAVLEEVLAKVDALFR